MTCLQPLRLKKKSKLLVSVAKEVVFLDEPDKSFKRFPIYWFRKIKKKILLLEEPMNLVKTGLLGNWKEKKKKYIYIYIFWQRNEGRSVLQSINDSLFPR